MKNAVHFIFLMSLTLLILSCSKRDSAGNSTETENAIAFLIVSPNETPAAGVAYMIRPLWFLPDTTKRNDSSTFISYGTTDEKGWIHLFNQPAGSYVIELMSDTLAGVLQFSYSQTPPEITKYEIVLQATGTVKGKVSLPDSVPYAWVQIYGLEHLTRTDSTGFFALNALPAGELHLIAWSPNHAATLGQASFDVLAGDTVDLGLLSAPTVQSEAIETWKYERFISAGALISEWMRPLASNTVLTLKLDSSTFDFSQAQPDGRDIRLLNAAGELLEIQRVRWDTLTRKAVLRLRIHKYSDTLDNWVLKWGNEHAIEPGNPNVWAGLSDSLFLALNSVEVSDFENQSSQNTLPYPIMKSSWYTGVSEKATISPSIDSNFVDALVPADSGRSGTAAHFTYKADYPEWALIGTRLGPGPRSLSTLDSIVFWFRGNGNYSVTFENLDTIRTRKAMYNGITNSSWTRIRVRPKDLIAADSIGGNYGWNFVKDQITHLTFFASNGSEFWIDDIRMFGISRDDLK